MADLDGQAVSRAADRLAETSLLRPEPPLSFLHPLLAAAVRATIRGHQRRKMELRAAAFGDRLASAASAEAPRPDVMIDVSTAPQGVVTAQTAIARTLRAEPRPHVVNLALLAWQESLLDGELVDPIDSGAVGSGAAGVRRAGAVSGDSRELASGDEPYAYT